MKTSLPRWRPASRQKQTREAVGFFRSAWFARTSATGLFPVLALENHRVGNGLSCFHQNTPRSLFEHKHFTSGVCTCKKRKKENEERPASWKPLAEAREKALHLEDNPGLCPRLFFLVLPLFLRHFTFFYCLVLCSTSSCATIQ